MEKLWGPLRTTSSEDIMPRTHFYSSYAAVSVLERLQKRYSLQDLSQMVEQSLLLIGTLDEKVDALLKEKPEEQWPPSTVLLTLEDFKQFLVRVKEPLESKARYSPGIVEHVTFPEVAASNSAQQSPPEASTSSVV